MAGKTGPALTLALAAALLSACAGGGLTTAQPGSSNCSPGPCSSAAGVTISVVSSKNDAANSEWELQLQVANRSSQDYTIVPGTHMTMAGSGGQSLDLLVNEGSGSQCWGESDNGGIPGDGPDYSIPPGKTIRLDTTFCFATEGAFTPANVQIQGSTPTTYKINLSG
jgi:hypothetical protein